MMSNQPEKKQLLAEKILEKAELGDVQAMKLIWNYLDGMPTQDINANMSGDVTYTVISKIPDAG